MKTTTRGGLIDGDIILHPTSKRSACMSVGLRMSAVKFAKIFLFGDSITQQSFSPGGWGARVADHFQRRADVLNRGFSGYNSDWAKPILRQLLVSREQADVVTILLGSNDAVKEGQLQHVPLDRYSQNLREILEYIGQFGIPTVLLTPPPVCDRRLCEQAHLDWPLDRENERTSLYAKVALEIGMERAVDTIDLYSAMVKEPDYHKYLSDGLHLNAAGGKFVAELVIPKIEPHLQKQKSVFPDWNDPELPQFLHVLSRK